MGTIDTSKGAIMTESQYSRSALILGADGITSLQQKTVAVFGIGGVGSFIAEALARVGVGRLILIDNDVVAESNINRQLVALHSTVGQLKVEVMKNRIADINPQTEVVSYPLFFTAETANTIDFSLIDYIADAIDTVSSKILLAEIAQERSISLISSMGTGNKVHPEMLELSDIYKTTVCPLARIMRYELKKRGIKKLQVVYSKEKVLPHKEKAPLRGKAPVPGSISFVPSAAGLLIAGQIVRDLLHIQ